MITLTMKCSHCSKTVSHDMTNKTLSNDLIHKFGFTYVYNGKTNMLVCTKCERSFKELKDQLENQTKTELYNFFEDYGKDKDNGGNRGRKNG